MAKQTSKTLGLLFIAKTFLFIPSQASGDAEMHPAGVHPYNFSFNLPQGLPSSFEGEYGYVRYECNAKIDKPWKFDHNAKVAFTVISHLDLNQEQNALMLRVSVECLGTALCTVYVLIEAQSLMDTQAPPATNILHVHEIRTKCLINIKRFMA